MNPDWAFLHRECEDGAKYVNLHLRTRILNLPRFLLEKMMTQTLSYSPLLSEILYFRLENRLNGKNSKTFSTDIPNLTQESFHSRPKHHKMILNKPMLRL